MNAHRFLDRDWYWVSSRFRDEQGATWAWRCLQRIGQAKKGKLELGVYRHGSPDSGMVVVTALGLSRRGVELAEPLLANGEPHALDTESLEALIARRVRVMADLLETQAPAGSYAIRRPRGALLNPDGTMEEQIGQG